MIQAKLVSFTNMSFKIWKMLYIVQFSIELMKFLPDFGHWTDYSTDIWYKLFEPVK